MNQDKINIIFKNLKGHGKLDAEELTLLNELITEIIDFDKQHGGNIILPLLLEKLILEVKLKSYQSW
jgi:uncharacterized membrane-anchored protein|tara:strand:- start:723 stop:923 length:201 start_codon:yes stop_codon:yes gene_type:complete